MVDEVLDIYQRRSARRILGTTLLLTPHRKVELGLSKDVSRNVPIGQAYAQPNACHGDCTGLHCR